MNVSFIALNISGAETVQSAADKIRSSFSELGRCDFKLCGSMSQVSAALSDAFANSDIIAVGAEPSVYSKAKLAILRAMHIKTQLDSSIQERIGNDSGLDDQQLSLHCAMPEKADVFMSDDGLFSGFAIRSGKQHFVMLPLDKLRVESQLSGGVLPYFNVSDVKIQSASSDESGEKQAKLNYAKNAIELLKEKNMQVYFASTPSCEMVKEMCSDTEGAFIFTEYTADRGNEAPRSYIADLARYSIPNDKDGLGAAVSNVYTGNSQVSGERKYNIYVALSDKNTSRVLRFASQPGETPDELVSASIELLMEMICEKCKGLGEPVGEDEQDKPFTAEPVEEIEIPTEQEVKAKKKSGLRTVLYVLLAIFLAFAGYFAFSGRENAEKNKEAAASSFASYYSQGAAAESGSLLVFSDVIDGAGDEESFLFEDVTTNAEGTQENTTAENTSVPEELPLLELTSEATAENKTEKITSTTKISTSVKPVTTAKPKTTTTKPVTTAVPATTAKPTTTAKPANNSKADGKFVFTVYGYGHGVGMSQEGALGYSRQGSSYTNILLHYYPGTTLVKDDPDMPETVRFGGKDYSVLEYLCRSVVGEIGSGCNSSTAEAFKAQAIALYTYAKRYSFNLSASMHAFNTSYKYEGSAAETAVKSVLGEYLAYEGKPIMATFFAMSAGKTVKASTVWSGNKYPYLEKSVDSPPDKKCNRYKTTYTVSAEDFRNIVKANLGVELNGEPSTWIRIEKHDSAVSSSVGYVERMSVGGKAITGAYFRQNVMQYKIRSHCFSVTYVEE